ncbi:adenylosuccinate lyase [Candidatus Purcelliella pentastirinorum]|uniref:Adenylosuccinate lyase n=1 Tax=Candidatus Purcelliella pentastirinorum TaxID=472834 RepID=A0AAX3N7X9_9ENTR|nr:adenylosuccinate lyase [Candidatus Purcelliella pentastirinorum]WDI78528.1 adenylosuccinate lyase [Candidatus Purcelliella pentastirinorum]
MKLNNKLYAISPIDGRYSNQVNEIREIFSEYALFQYRIKIEIFWLEKLSRIPEIKEIPNLNKKTKIKLYNIIKNFNIKDAKKIKKIENIINHDIKALEYFLKKEISKIKELKKNIEFIHFACTSDDINNLAYALMLKDAKKNIFIPYWNKIIKKIKKIAKKYTKTALLTYTHGQIASTSTIGKEMTNFIYRMERQKYQLKKIKILGKMNGTVGNYNAHLAAYPNINWNKISKEFVNSLKITWNPYTTQIEPHDYISELLTCIIRFNIININLVSDIWRYISIKFFIQKYKKKEVGSSIMPNKINPIDFENAESNLKLSNSIMQHLSTNLPISRWQRDLRDSTLLRNIGLSFAYSIIAYKKIIKGISTLKINKKYIKKKINDNWQILTEAIQTIMRSYKIKKPYEKLKKITRGKKITKKDVKKFINKLSIPKKEKNKLKKITPENYIGNAINLTKDMEKYINKLKNQ